MLPRKILTVASGRQYAASVAHHFQRRRIDVPASPAHLPRLFFSSLSDGKGRPEEHDIGDHHAQQQQEEEQQQNQRDQSKGAQPSQKLGTQRGRTSKNPNNYRSRHKSDSNGAQSRKQQSSSTKNAWRAPFWRPPPPSSSSSPRKTNDNDRNHQRPSFRRRKINSFRSASLPCRKHLDPTNSMGFPTSDWVEIFGTLPMTSLEEVLDSIENILRKETSKSDGVVDLDAEWNPHTDGEDLPLVPSVLEIPIIEPALRERREYALDKDSSNKSTDINVNSDCDGTNNETTMTIESFRVVKAHVVLSPFGRPTGWNLKLANPSMVHAFLSVTDKARVKGVHMVGWKFTKVKEHHPPPTTKKPLPYDASDTRTMLVVSDSMVRFENCPADLTQSNLRFMLSRFELTRKGTTIIRWKGRIGGGRVQPVTYVVRFDSPAYARAAVREMQGKMFEGRLMKLVQYPRQLF